MIPGFPIIRKVRQKYNIDFLFRSLTEPYRLDLRMFRVCPSSNPVHCLDLYLPVEISHTQGVIQIQDNFKHLIHINIILSLDMAW